MEVDKMKNIDAITNKLGFELVEKINNVGDKKLKGKLKSNIEKSLGVLINDGVYAYYVFCKRQDKDRQGGNFQEIFIKHPIKILSEIIKLEANASVSNNALERFFQKLSENLSQLLFFRQLLGKVLIYARYHSQAMGDDE